MTAQQLQMVKKLKFGDTVNKYKRRELKSRPVRGTNLDLPVLFEGQLDEGVLALLVGSWLLVGGGRVQVDHYFSTTQ